MPPNTVATINATKCIEGCGTSPLERTANSMSVIVPAENTKGAQAA